MKTEGGNTTIKNDERIIQKTSGGWQVNLSKNVKGDLILTNKRIIIGDSSNSFYLTDVMQIEFLPIYKIKLTLRDRTENLIFSKRSMGHAIDQFASVLFATPYEAGSWQEEVSSYTAHWASILTMALLLYGEPIEFEEVKYEDKKAWCHNCKKYVKVPWTDTQIWKIKCSVCGHADLTTLSPEDKDKRDRFFG